MSQVIDPIKYLHRRGMMIVLSSPSGAGKSSLAREILARNPKMMLSVSVTTRAPRPNETDGKDYYFVSQEEFEKMRDEGSLLEWAKVFGNYYGTPKKAVTEALENAQDVMFDIDWQGTQQISQNMEEKVVSIFILPPSIKELEGRLQKRAEDSDDIIKDRMSQAASEISHWAEYDYVIINKDFEESIISIQSIVNAERLKRNRQVGLSSFIKSLTYEN
jgi:guanylate kinase